MGPLEVWRNYKLRREIAKSLDEALRLPAGYHWYMSFRYYDRHTYDVEIRKWNPVSKLTNLMCPKESCRVSQGGDGFTPGEASPDNIAASAERCYRDFNKQRDLGFRNQNAKWGL